YWDRLYRWLYHLTRDRHAAEDLTQETFLRALAAVKSFRPGSNFRAWVFRIGHNNFVNQKRAERRTKHPLPVDEGLSFREVAKVLGTTEETARWRVFKARQKLMKVLSPELLPPGAVSE